MLLRFSKLNGLGNDFVMIDDRDSKIELSADQVAYLCDRRFGIGADGVILVRPAVNEGCDALMYYINSDGTLAQMCGNGVRCFAKFLVDEGIAGVDGKLVADTLSGPKPITYTTDDEGQLSMATVDMGAPILAPAEVPTALKASDTSFDGTPYVRDTAIESPWGPFEFTCVSMGNPHAICYIDNWEDLPDNAFKGAGAKSLSTFDVDTVGEFFESHEAFPEKTNVEFAEIREGSIGMRVFERGCRETFACGTGACATSVAATLTGRAGRVNDVELLGGTLHIDWRDNGHVFMTGPAALSFTGEVEV